jgi:hypothetical protein
MSGNFPGATKNPPGAMTPGNAMGGGLTALDPATGLPYGADANVIDPATGLPRGYVQGQPQMNNPAFGGMNPGLRSGGPGTTGATPFTPPPTWQRTQGSSSPMSMDVVDQYVDPATGQRYNMVGQPIGNPDTFGAPSLPGQYPNLMQNPAFNPAAGQPQPQPPAPPTLAEQIASPAPGVQQLIGQLSLQQRARPAMSQLSQMSAPQIQPPQPVQQPPIADLVPRPAPVPQARPTPDQLSLPVPAPQPLMPPQPQPGPQQLRMPMSQSAPMPTRATQGYVSRLPQPAPRPVPVKQPPAVRPAPKPVTKAAAKPVRR